MLLRYDPRREDAGGSRARKQFLAIVFTQFRMSNSIAIEGGCAFVTDSSRVREEIQAQLLAD